MEDDGDLKKLITHLNERDTVFPPALVRFLLSLSGCVPAEPLCLKYASLSSERVLSKILSHAKAVTDARSLSSPSFDSRRLTLDVTQFVLESASIHVHKPSIFFECDNIEPVLESECFAGRREWTHKRRKINDDDSVSVVVRDLSTR
eukprot:GHVR01064748.1.p1 GENE.GHVR01064748.1~~GHVR01064748.1.p1  ORF type:complete len:147 (+),score=1.79 GHVR01064748.1:464-904(+)